MFTHDELVEIEAALQQIDDEYGLSVGYKRLPVGSTVAECRENAYAAYDRGKALLTKVTRERMLSKTWERLS